MSKIKILAIPPDTHGVGKYRILDPYKYIGDNHSNEIHVDIAFKVEDDDEIFKNYDVVVFHSFIHQTQHETNIKRINWLKSNGIKVVMDIDDMWTVDQRHPMYHQIKENKIAEKKVEMLRLADYVTTTTPIFADTIKERIGLKNVFIFPNAVDENESQFQSNPIESELVRFGWLGGSSHLHDLELLEKGISSTHSSYKDKVQFVLCGFDLRGTVTEINKETGQINRRDIRPMETVWYKYENMFTDKYQVLDEDYRNYLLSFVNSPYGGNDLTKPYVRRWTKDVNSYATNYNYFDVSLAPLVESVFNDNKSQLKVIEAGFHKKALIASETKPYTLDLVSALEEGKFNSKGNALLVSPNKNHKQWSQHMKKLMDNPNMIEDLGNRLYETVKDKYSLRNVSKDRIQFFNSIINK
jgi:glycosyltransferase involved in cell wall biosynthesis